MKIGDTFKLKPGTKVIVYGSSGKWDYNPETASNWECTIEKFNSKSIYFSWEHDSFNKKFKGFKISKQQFDKLN